MDKDKSEDMCKSLTNDQIDEMMTPSEPIPDILSHDEIDKLLIPPPNNNNIFDLPHIPSDEIGGVLPSDDHNRLEDIASPSYRIAKLEAKVEQLEQIITILACKIEEDIDLGPIGKASTFIPNMDLPDEENDS